MSKKKENDKMELFFPYYVNQGRLLDIYAILNGGYSEYTEVSTSLSDEKAKNNRAELSANGGFKLINFGSGASVGSEKSSIRSSENKEKKVQTVTSVLSIVKSTLQSKGYLRDIKASKPGDFVCLPVTLSINSIESLFSEMSELIKLYENMLKLEGTQNTVQKSKREMDGLMKAVKGLFEGEEIVFEADDFAVIGSIVDSNLYQSVRADIIGTELNCLAQVKRVFPNGTELMKNTLFSRIKDNNAKQNLIDIMNGLVSGDVFEFESVAISSIQNKPVYQLEIIALYQ